MKKREIIEYMKESTYKPLTAEELVNELEIEDASSFLSLLRELEKEGEVICTRKQKYGIPERMGLLVGTFQCHPKGYGFLLPERKPKHYKGGDVFISPSNINGAMHNDKVIVRLSNVSSTLNKPEGEIIRIIERRNETVVGTLELNHKFGFVIPDDPRIDQDIFVPFEQLSRAKDGDKVVVKITKWPESKRSPTGEIIEILGVKGEKGVDVLSIVRKYNLPEDFSKKVLKETEKLSPSLQEEMDKRKDLRDMRLVTIDGADAKDLDDAVSISRLDNGNYCLGVHIADVGFYVEEGSKLDKEAFQRGTSVYLVDRVIPMLPPRLSNDVCSLNAGCDRLSLSVIMEVDHQGSVRDFEITPSTINVDRRLTYDEVNEVLENNNNEFKLQLKDFLEDFYCMQELCGILKRKRTQRGAIDFDFPESKVILDDEGRPVEIEKVERGIAEKIIEEFMILANETVSEYAYWQDIPFIYRVHESPTEDNLQSLNSFLGAFGFFLKLSDNTVHPAKFQEIIAEAKNRPEEKVINTVMLRSMQHAHYSNVPLGHFGLASKYYSHFTSPIRRYPDLVIHRILRELIEKGTLSSKRVDQLRSLTDKASENSSLRERVAEEAERESVDLKKIEYMERHLGDVFPGIIAGVTGFGFFVELENTVEGLVHVSTLTDDFYHFDDVNFSLRGENTGRIFKIGDEVKVQIVKADIEKKELDLELVE